MKKLLQTLSLNFICFVFGILFSSASYALVFPLEKDQAVVGCLQEAVVEPGDDLNTIARRYDLGYYELVEANPDITPDNLTPGTPLTIPSRFILPNVPRQGIVVNLPELRLYYFPKNKNEVWTYPIGIGRQGWLTPLCVTHIISKKEKPTWIVPKSIQADRAAQGVTLPDKVLPGPNNPLGNYAMRLGLQTYLIHGTNDPRGVGRRSSAGCVRMFPEDVEVLFKDISVGAPVRIINESTKIGWLKNKLYLEAHIPLQEQQKDFENDLSRLVSEILTATHQNKDIVDWDKVDRLCEDRTGIPSCIAILEKSPQNGPQPEVKEAVAKEPPVEEEDLITEIEEKLE